LGRFFAADKLRSSTLARSTRFVAGGAFGAGTFLPRPRCASSFSSCSCCVSWKARMSDGAVISSSSVRATRRSASLARSFRGGSFARGSGVHVRVGSPYRRGFYGRLGYPYYPYAGYYPYGYCGSYGDGLDCDTGSQDQDQDSYGAYYQAPASPDSYAENSGLQRDVQTLNGKIDRLQADVEARNRKPDVEPATALVFRDQHVEEVHNYAISGGNLWVINDSAAKKIPLAQLDIDATVKMNDDRGVDFQVPQPALQIMIVR